MNAKVECAFVCVVVKDPKHRVAQSSGKPWVSFLVRVGEGDAASCLQVSVFGDCVANLTDLKAGEQVYIEGDIRLNEWTAGDGANRHGLAVSSFKAQILGRIGNRRPKRNSSAAQGRGREGSSPLQAGAASRLHGARMTARRAIPTATPLTTNFQSRSRP